MSPPSFPTTRIPIHVLTGFLGAGKTTVLSALLEDPGDERIAVLINELAGLPIDPHLLARVDSGVLTLASGCICCELTGELRQAVERVAGSAPSRIVLETTGLADPAPVLHALATDRGLSGRARLAGVVAVADATRIAEQLESEPEARRQLELADRVVLTRCDLAPERAAEARRHLAALAPGCEIRAAEQGRVERAWLLAERPLGAVRDAHDARAWLHHGPRDPALRTHAVESSAPARIELLQLWLRLVTQLDGPRLLRVKGLAECDESGELFVLQSAGRALSPPRRLGRRPPGIRGVQLVIVERGLDERARAELLASLRSALSRELRADGALKRG